MEFRNKNRIAYLGALALLFSYAELLLPRFLPFFRFGFGNIALLLAFDLNFPSYLLLVLLKTFAAAFTGGTLFSPFVVISLCQSFASGIVMFGLSRLRGRWLSVYGISFAGGGISAVVQILVAALYLGPVTFGLLGPMLLFCTAAAFITAFLSEKFRICSEVPVFEAFEAAEESDDAERRDDCSVIPLQASGLIQNHSAFLVALIICSTILIFLEKNLLLLCASLILCFVLQLLSGRKIRLLPHFVMWIFVIVLNIFVPSGKILFAFGDSGFGITEGALSLGFSKALKLSCAMALSQCGTSLRFSEKSLLGLSLAYFNGLTQIFNETKGSFIKKLKTALEAKIIVSGKIKKNQMKKGILILFSALFAAVFLLDFFNLCKIG